MSGPAPPGHIDEARLHDYVDGVLGPEAERRVARHLRACLTCRREEEAVRSLTADLAELPDEIRPERDLRPGIARRIERGGAPRPREAARVLRYPLAAAAVLLVVCTAWLTTVIVDGGAGPRSVAGRGAAGPVAVGPMTGGSAAAADARALHAAYLPAIRQLAGILERRRSELSPETVRTLEENLRVIDRAIEESRRALATDPDDRVLRELLVVGYETKVEFLRRAAALTARS